jgi:hypothetical protein
MLAADPEAQMKRPRATHRWPLACMYGGAWTATALKRVVQSRESVRYDGRVTPHDGLPDAATLPARMVTPQTRGRNHTGRVVTKRPGGLWLAQGDHRRDSTCPTPKNLTPKGPNRPGGSPSGKRHSIGVRTRECLLRFVPRQPLRHRATAAADQLCGGGLAMR